MSDLLEIVNQDTLLVEVIVASTFDVIDEQTVAVAEEVITLISEAVQGPQGIQGVQGPQGNPGGASVARIAAVNLGGHRIVTLNGAGHADYATNATLSHSLRIVGMTVGAIAAGSSVEIQNFGELTEPSWSWDTGKPVYLSVDGLLTQVEPVAPGAKFSLVVGFPTSSTSLFVNIGIPISLI